MMTTLGPSQADITVTDVAGARYWLAGCVQNVGETLHYVPVSRFSRESPDKLFCDNRLKTTVVAATEPLCANTVLNIAVHSSLTNQHVQNRTTSVIITRDDTQQTVEESASSDENGAVKIPFHRMVTM